MRFTDREKAFEDKFAHDEEIMFKVRARRNRQVGLWAAGKMGYGNTEAQAYADALVKEMLDKEKLHNRIKSDLSKAPTPVSDDELFTRLDEFVQEARTYFMENK